jgi:hypothetical protein
MRPVKWENCSNYNNCGHLSLIWSPACVMDGILIKIGIFSLEVNRAKTVVYNKSLKQNTITFLLEDPRPMGKDKTLVLIFNLKIDFTKLRFVAF